MPSWVDYDQLPYYDRPDADTLKGFIGPNQESMFILMHNGLPKMNWFAALSGIFYYIYRKCWNGLLINVIWLALCASLLWLVGYKALAMPLVAVGIIFGLLRFLSFGLLFYPTYKYKYMRVYSRYQYKVAKIPAKGGISTEYVMVALSVLLIILVVINLLI